MSHRSWLVVESSSRRSVISHRERLPRLSLENVMDAGAPSSSRTISQFFLSRMTIASSLKATGA